MPSIRRVDLKSCPQELIKLILTTGLSVRISARQFRLGYLEHYTTTVHKIFKKVCNLI